MSAALQFRAPYRVIKHEHFDDEFVKVEVHCSGYPTHGIQPDEWYFVLKVPKPELVNWPIGAMVTLAVTGAARAAGEPETDK